MKQTVLFIHVPVQSPEPDEGESNVIVCKMAWLGPCLTNPQEQTRNEEKIRKLPNSNLNQLVTLICSTLGSLG